MPIAIFQREWTIQDGIGCAIQFNGIGDIVGERAFIQIAGGKRGRQRLGRRQPSCVP